MSSEPDSQDHQRDDSRHLKRSFLLAASFVAFLWAIKLAELVFAFDLVGYGIYPGRPSGLAGVLWAPLIHGSVLHLFANTAPVLVLGTALLYAYPRSAGIVIPAVYLGAGLGVWLFARQAYHIGASGLTSGLMFFLFTVGVLRWDRRAIALSMVVFFLYGGMIWGIFPGDPAVSFESHLAGAAVGVVAAVVLRNRDPVPPEKKYSWEEEPDDELEADDEPPDNVV